MLLYLTILSQFDAAEALLLSCLFIVYLQEMSGLLDSIAKSTIDVFRQHATVRQDSTSGSNHREHQR